jgi:hypothetical protein
VRHRGSDLLQAHRRQFPKEERRQTARDIGKRVAVEKQEGRAAVIPAQIVERLR